MLPVNVPSHDDLAVLTKNRNEASVSIYLKSSPRPMEAEAVQLAVKNAASDAEAQLKAIGADPRVIAQVKDSIDSVESDREFWERQAHGLAIFAAPGILRTFKLANRVQDLVAVGDRFDVGTLLRSITFPHGGYIVAVTEGGAKLFELSTDQRATATDLPLPADLHTVLEHTTTGGRFDRHRATGATGPRIEQQRYCRLVQDAVLERIGDRTMPMILAASDEFEPAYRVINTYDGLLERGIDVNPDSLTVDELDARARRILDDHYRDTLSEWRELFGTRRSHGRATSKLKEVARAATTGAVDDLMFDMDSTLEGVIDESGELELADAPGPTTYNVVDEIAVRVLAANGSVKAVRNEDLLDGSPVAAMLRFPLENLPLENP